MKKILSLIKKAKGFTLIELVVSLGIFALMTALLLAKYGSFNQGVLLTNLAYDVAITIRNAQSYGLNVKSSDRMTDSFRDPYGVHFSTSPEVNKLQFTFFVDKVGSDGKYTTESEKLSTTNILRGSYIEKLYVGTDASNITETDVLDITFKRPDPNAIIRTSTGGPYTYAEIILKSNSSNDTRKVTVISTGQISVI